MDPDALSSQIDALAISGSNSDGRHISAPNKGDVYWGDADVFMKAGPVVVWAPKVGLDNFEEENVKFQQAVVDVFFPDNEQANNNEEQATFFMAINFVNKDVLVLTATIDTDTFLDVVVPRDLKASFGDKFEYRLGKLNPLLDDNRHKSSGRGGKTLQHEVYPDSNRSCKCVVCDTLRPQSQFKIFLLERQCRPVVGTRELNDTVKSRSDLQDRGEYKKRVSALLNLLEYVNINPHGCSITYNSRSKARAKVFVVKAVIPVREFFQVYYKFLSTTLRAYHAKKELTERARMTPQTPMWKKHEEFFKKETSHTAAMLIYNYIQTH